MKILIEIDTDTQRVQMKWSKMVYPRVLTFSAAGEGEPGRDCNNGENHGDTRLLYIDKGFTVNNYMVEAPITVKWEIGEIIEFCFAQNGVYKNNHIGVTGLHLPDSACARACGRRAGGRKCKTSRKTCAAERRSRTGNANLHRKRQCPAKRRTQPKRRNQRRSP